MLCNISRYGFKSYTIVYKRQFSSSDSQAMARTYADAVRALNTLQTNFAVIEAIRKSGGRMNQNAIPEMVEWCRRIGYEPKEFDKLRPIHVAGTKGKGSTCAFVSSILQQYPDRKIGLYTSPHLRAVRERIQLNSVPLSETKFAKYFFEVWDRLESSANALGKDPADKPVYFRYLTLMAFHAFLSEGVDTAVVEVGIGGEYDSTNILVKPSVTGISSLGVDHVNVLGETVEKIAWHKAGIMKPGVPVLTIVPQPGDAISVIRDRAKEKGAPLTEVPSNPELEKLHLGLAGSFQTLNASLAVQLAAKHLDISTKPSLPSEFVRGLETTKWPGRCETRKESETLSWYLDGGHTAESLAYTAGWFEPLGKSSSSKRVLLFNQQTRDASALLRHLHNSLPKGFFDLAIFTSNVTFRSGSYKPDLTTFNADPNKVVDLKVQNELATAWKNLETESGVKQADAVVVSTIQEALRTVRNYAQDHGQTMCLVTGSLHLVGGVMEVLESPPPSPTIQPSKAVKV